MVETDLQKALQVAESFRPGRDETAVSHLVSGVARSQERSLDELEDVVRTFVQRGFKSEQFFSAVACAVDGKLEKTELRLSDDIVTLLEDAVRGLTNEPVRILERSGNDREESILWNSSFGQPAAMEGLRPMVAALTQHYFAADPPETEKWLDLLNYGVRLRSDPLTWQSLALTDLWRLNRLDYQSVRTFVKTLLQEQPEVLTCHTGVFLINFLMHILEPSYVAEVVDQLRNSAWNLGEQAAGELAAVDFFVRKNSWSRHIVEEALTTGTDERLAAGVVYTTGRAWLTESHRKESVPIMSRLLQLNNERVSRALASKMRLSETNVPDNETFWLMDLLCSRPSLFRRGFAYIVEAVPDLMVRDPERIYNLLKAFTDEVGKDFLNHSQALRHAPLSCSNNKWH